MMKIGSSQMMMKEKSMFLSYKGTSVVAIYKFFLIWEHIQLITIYNVYELLWLFSDGYAEEEYICPPPDTLEDRDLEANQDENN